MCAWNYSSTTLLGCFLAAASVFLQAHADPIVPALFIFGDSVVDVGNNNNLITLVKANFLPYGRDFVTHNSTGRFCNGKLASDYTAEYLGFSSYPPAYLGREAGGSRLLTGANFASGGSGYYDATATLYNTISLTQQFRYFNEYQAKLVSMVGQTRADSIVSGGIHLISAGSSDFVQNYYINPVLSRTYTPDRFTDVVLMGAYSTFIRNLYKAGARRIGVTTLPPLGCLPAVITLFGVGSNQCVARLNQDAVSFNSKLNLTSRGLQVEFPDLKLVVFDIYQPLYDLITKPTDSGFFESRRACCGTGTLETSYLCNTRSVGTCSNATQYVFWDGFHPSDAANQLLASSLLSQGISLIS